MADHPRSHTSHQCRRKQTCRGIGLDQHLGPTFTDLTARNDLRHTQDGSTFEVPAPVLKKALVFESRDVIYTFKAGTSKAIWWLSSATTVSRLNRVAEELRRLWRKAFQTSLATS
jgi:hypothetical protein